MNGYPTKLLQLMDGAGKRFVIPVYQRNYDWKKDNCRQLFDDLVKVVKNKRENHFFGSIVSVDCPNGHFDEHLIIDGQQRLTTVSLLLLAMYRLMTEKKVVPEKPSLPQEIYETYLINKFSPNEMRMKLKPIKNDKTAFEKLFQGDPSEYVADSNLTLNYQYFYDWIQETDVSIDQLYDAFFKLQIIIINLQPGDDPQLIFESLNSTGLALSEGDKIRNLILMNLDQKKQETYYEQYWNKIEICTDYDVSAFVRDYLSVKLNRIPTISKVYYEFKDYIETKRIELEPLLKDLLVYAQRYEKILCGKTENKSLNNCITRLNRLETTVTRPFFLEVLRLQEEKQVSDNDILSIFTTIESYLFRRTICELPTNALSKLFLTLHKEITQFDGCSNYFEKMKYVLRSKKDRVRFPDDSEFAEAIGTKPIYLMNRKNKIYLMERFENFGTKECKDIWEHIDCGDYSIEHIMPQNLSLAWRKSLGGDCDDIHNLWLHRLANLTLTAYNSKYSNRSFSEKRDMQNGFRESGIKMNFFIAQKESWGQKELEERSEMMKKKALQIWEMPTSSFIPSTLQLDSYALDDDTDFTGRIISQFSYKGSDPISVQSWMEMYQQVLTNLHLEDKSILTSLALNDTEVSGITTYVSSSASHSNSKKWIEIDTKIYVWVPMSTQHKILILGKFFKQFDVDSNELVFFLEPEK